MGTDRTWEHDEDHGIHADEGPHRILVEAAAFGPTQREGVKVLRELAPHDPLVTFNWGYVGSGPNAAAKAILTDAFGWEPTLRMRHAFVWDVLGVAAGEFRLRRPAIIRWARGLTCSTGLHELRPPLDEIPPVDPGDYARTPAGDESERRLK